MSSTYEASIKPVVIVLPSGMRAEFSFEALQNADPDDMAQLCKLMSRVEHAIVQESQQQQQPPASTQPCVSRTLTPSGVAVQSFEWERNDARSVQSDSDA
jgi:hypothetical protein